MTKSVEVIGLERIQNKLDPSVMLDKPVQGLWNRVGSDLVQDAQVKSPYRTGDLRGHIEFKAVEHSMWFGVDAPEGSGLWFKARAMEYGTGRRGDPAVSHTSRVGMKAHPYLRPALADGLGKIRSALADMGKSIREAWDKH